MHLRLLAFASAVALAFSAPVVAQDEGLPAPRATKSTDVITGFDPKVDGLPFPNAGNYASHGDCIGMSLLAIDRFLRRQAGEAPPVNEVPKGPPLNGDPVDHEVAGIAQALSGDVRIKGSKLNDPKPLNDALARMKETGRPITLGLDGRLGGHTVALFGFKDGKLQIYDPNFPGETIEWPFDPVKGLGPHPKAKGAKGDAEFYGSLSEVAPIATDKYPVFAQLAKIRGECDTRAKECTAKYAEVTAEAKPAEDKKSVTISGKVTRGLTRGVEGPTDPPKRVWVRVNGVLQRESAAIKKDGSYSLVLPASALRADGKNEVQVIAATGESSFAGFARVAPFELGAPARGRGITGALGR